MLSPRGAPPQAKSFALGRRSDRIPAGRRCYLIVAAASGNRLRGACRREEELLINCRLVTRQRPDGANATSLSAVKSRGRFPFFSVVVHSLREWFALLWSTRSASGSPRPLHVALQEWIEPRRKPLAERVDHNQGGGYDCARWSVPPAALRWARRTASDERPPQLGAVNRVRS